METSHTVRVTMAPAVIVFVLVLCLCVGVVSSDHKGSLKVGEQKAKFAAVHTGNSLPGCVLTQPNGSHTKSHTEKPSIEETHVCRIGYRCQNRT